MKSFAGGGYLPQDLRILEGIMKKLVFLLPLIAWCQALAASPGLLVIDRNHNDDRARLIEQGVPLVAEFSTALLALGDPAAVGPAVQALGYSTRVIEDAVAGRSYSMVVARQGVSRDALAACGAVIFEEPPLAVVRDSATASAACRANPGLIVSPLPLRLLAAPLPPPAAYAAGHPRPEAIVIQPLVTDMVGELTDAVALAHWTDIVDSQPTRHSTSAGCQAAAAAAFAHFCDLGLNPVYQDHTTGHAPNVVGQLTGTVTPEHVVIVIAHLDDMPDTGTAPGADDNASGSGMVTALADIMSGYTFENTVKFLLVTGEEFGLYGSYFYAADAETRREQIDGVLNGDMIGWQGDGAPVPENLDTAYNDSSRWLGELFAEAATVYATGCAVDAYLCPSERASDHAPFWDRGYSAVMGITDGEGTCGHNGDYPFYHTENDTMANCGDPAFFGSAARAYLATAAHLARPTCRNPAVPTNVAAAFAARNTIDVTWNPSPGRVVYEVYRSRGGCDCAASFQKIGETVDASFRDTDASGMTTYGYQVRTRNKAGDCVSGPGACVEGVAFGDCLERPVFAGLESVRDDQASTCALTLSWSDPAILFCTPAAVFNIYRSTDPLFEPGPATLIGSCATGSTFTDTDVDPLVRYTYLVRAEDTGAGTGGPCGGREDVNTVKRSGTATGAGVDLFADGFESGGGAWGPDPPWSITNAAAASGTWSAHGGNQADICAALTLANPVTLPTGVASKLSFWASYALEQGYDGVQVQVSADGGASWSLLTPESGYPGSPSARCSLKQNTAGFTGATGGWVRYVADLTPFAGQGVRIRFVMMSDRFVDDGGFFVDDVRVYRETSCGTRLDVRDAAARDACALGGAGDADGTLDPGETGEVTFTVTNPGAIDATGVMAALDCASPWITVVNGSTTLDDIAPGATGGIAGPPLTFAVDPAAPCGTPVVLSLHVSIPGRTWDFDVAASIGRPSGTPVTALSEDFEGAVLPAGWSVEDGGGDGKTWFMEGPGDPTGCGTFTPGAPIAGSYAAVDSECAGAAALDEGLVTPVVDLSDARTARMEFDHAFRRFFGERAEVEVRSSKTAGAWVTAASFAESTPDARHESIDISAPAAGASDVAIRFRYSQANDDWFWYVDNVTVTYDAASDCLMEPCMPIPDEVSRPGSAHPLLIARDPACATGICMYFEKMPYAQGYDMYEGTIGTWYSHAGTPGTLCGAPMTDLGDGTLRLSLDPSAGDRYYVATAFNARGEGTAGSPEKDVQATCPP